MPAVTVHRHAFAHTSSTTLQLARQASLATCTLIAAINTSKPSAFLESLLSGASSTRPLAGNGKNSQLLPPLDKTNPTIRAWICELCSCRSSELGRRFLPGTDPAEIPACIRLYAVDLLQENRKKTENSCKSAHMFTHTADTPS